MFGYGSYDFRPKASSGGEGGEIDDPTALKQNKNLADLTDVEAALVNLTLGGIKDQIQANTDVLSAMSSASSQFGSKIPQNIPKLADGFSTDMTWENIRLNNNTDIIEAVEDAVIFKKEGTYQFISHLALRRTSGTSGTANISFQLYIDGEPYNSEITESVNLEINKLIYLPVMVLVDLKEEDLGTMTVRCRMGGPADVKIVEFNSTLVRTPSYNIGETGFPINNQE